MVNPMQHIHWYSHWYELKIKLISKYSTLKCTAICHPCLVDVYRGYYTVARRYEFYFRVAKQYFTNERSEWVNDCFCHEKIKFISSRRRVMFFLLYRHADDGVFDDFPTTFRRFPKIFQNCSEYQTNVSEHFPKISEHVRRFLKIAEDFRGRPEDVSMIYQRI